MRADNLMAKGDLDGQVIRKLILKTSDKYCWPRIDRGTQGFTEPV
jgi:hypothetical protein